MIAEWHLLDTGSCLAEDSHVYPGGGSSIVAVHALCALLRHERYGWFLFDTGYAPRVYEAASGFPYGLYARATPMRITASDAVVNQIACFGLTASDIGTVIVSHFHADHIGGLHDFPQTRFVCSRSAFEAVRPLTGFAAVRRAFLPRLLPEDFDQRATFAEDLPESDLFGDGSAILVPLPGHARGQIGLRAHTTDARPLFLAADAAYSARAIRERVPFHPLTRLFQDDFTGANRTLRTLHTYHRENPDTILLPTHCPEALARCTR